MQRNTFLFVLMLVSLMFFSISPVFAAQGGVEGPPPSAFTGTVFALSFAFVLGLGGIILYGTSKGDSEQTKTKGVKNTRTSKSKEAQTSNKPVKTNVNQDKKNLRKQLLDGEIDEDTYLEEVNKLK